MHTYRYTPSQRTSWHTHICTLHAMERCEGTLTYGVASLQLTTSWSAPLGIGRVVFLHLDRGCFGNRWRWPVYRQTRDEAGETWRGDVHRLGLLLQSVSEIWMLRIKNSQNTKVPKICDLVSSQWKLSLNSRSLYIYIKHHYCGNIIVECSPLIYACGHTKPHLAIQCTVNKWLKFFVQMGTKAPPRAEQIHRMERSKKVRLGLISF